MFRNLYIEYFKKFIFNKNTIRSLIFCLTVCVYQPSHSIRLVLSGGGMAEMMALSSLAQLPAFLVMISNHPTVLNTLTVEEKMSIQQLAFRPELRPGYFEIEFEVGDEARKHMETPKSLHGSSSKASTRIFIRNRDLYDQENQPKSFNEISKIVFELLIQYPKMVSLLNDLYLLHLDWPSLLSQVYSHVTPKFETTYLGREDVQLIAFNVDSIEGKPIQSLMWLRSEGENLDLTEKVISAVNCHSTPIISQLGRFRVRQQIVVGQINWVCGGAVYSGRLGIPLAQLVNGVDLDFRVSQVTEISKIFVDCNEAIRGF